jgi:RHH-type proline utilization regulon transcriptional repressor/proline dehydrogenase/delta 1-pyrroline-5-carboxylate dehydrogenase
MCISLGDEDPEARAYVEALGGWPHVIESEDELAARLEADGVSRIRSIGKLGSRLREAARAGAVHCEESTVLANGRVELLRYLREQSISVDYHRHGNLGDREAEPRARVS